MPAIRFSVLDLIISFAILLIGFGAVLPSLGIRHHEDASRIKCAANLRQIGLAMKMYANGELRTQAYPRTKYVDGAKPSFFTGVNASNPFSDDGPAPNDVTAAMFLILRTQDITPDVFICPISNMDPFKPDPGKKIADYSNFRGPNELSYSYANPYGNHNSISNGFIFNDAMSADFAVAADIGSIPKYVNAVKPDDPTSKQRLANSPVHDGDGQNVLYADGHCDWVTTVFQGAQADNIYTSGASDEKGQMLPPDPDGSSTCANDSVILPLWDEKVLGSPTSSQSVPIRYYLPDGDTIFRWCVRIITLLLAGYMAYRSFRYYNPPTKQTPPPWPR